MPDVFIGLKEAAAFEGISYDTIKKRVQRNPQQYKTKMQPSEAGGREQVLVSVDSLTAKGRKAWRAAQKIDGRDVVIEKRTESAPWYVGVDLNHYTEQHKKAFYEAVELAARVQDFIDYDGPDRTAYAERYALGLGVTPDPLPLRRQHPQGERLGPQDGEGGRPEPGLFPGAVLVSEAEGDRHLPKSHG